MNWQGFEAAYSRQLWAMANRLFSQWVLPWGVSVDDVHQELLMGAWIAWNDYAEGRGGMTREAFSVCSARLHAARWIHVQRSAVRRSGSAPSRVDTLIPLDEEIDECASVFATQTTALEFKEALAVALKRCRGIDKQALDALVRNGFDVDAGTAAISSAGVKERRARESVRRAYRQMQAVYA